MKSNSISGLGLSLIPGDSTVQNTQAAVALIANPIIQNSNNFYLFTGPVPATEVLQAYNNVATVLVNHGSNKILEIKNFDVRYTYDKIKKVRKFQKWPVDSLTYTSAITGTATWGMLQLNPLSPTSSATVLVFTDAVGGWDDPDQSILISSTTVTAGEEIIVKDINFTIQDALVREL